MKTNISLIAWKMKLKTSNQQLIFVFVKFSLHILICIFLLHPILFYSGDLNSTSSSQTSFLPGRWWGCGQGSWPRAGDTCKSGWSPGHIGWTADGVDLRGHSSSCSSQARRCRVTVCCLWPVMHRDLQKVLFTFQCAQPSNFNEGIVGIFNEKCLIYVQNRL